MDELHHVLICGLRCGYLSRKSLPHTAIWGRLPEELRSALAEALARDEPIHSALTRWRRQVGFQPTRDDTGQRTQYAVDLQLGLLYLRYRDGRIGARELLTQAFHIADSYACHQDGRTFLELRRSAETGGEVESRITELFGPYQPVAEVAVEQWGLGPA